MVNVRWYLVVCLVATIGCFKLDPFLYSATRTDHYVFDPDGGEIPEETVDAGQVSPPIQIATDDGIILYAVYVKATVQPPRGYCIFFHGKGGTMDTNFYRVKRFANMGYDTMAFDYRGFGMSTNVAPSEAGIARDSEAVRSYMLGHIPGRDPSRLFYYGHSFGTAVATQRAAIDPPTVLYLEAAFASADEFARESTQLDIPYDFVAHDPWDTAGTLPSIHSPLLIIHGTADGTIRLEQDEINYAAANDPKKLVVVQGGNHSNLPSFMGDMYAETITGWVNSYLPP